MKKGLPVFFILTGILIVCMVSNSAGLSIFCGLLYNTNGALAEDQTSARAAYAIDLQTGRMLFDHNANEQMPMASTTKVMTALLALERGDLDEMVTAGDAAYGAPGTSIYLDRGETLSLEQMLYGLMLASGNDAAIAIAEHIGGSVDGFAQMMNERAVALGATKTNFINPNGLPATGHVTTARDLTLIAAAAMENTTFREIVSTQRASIPWEGRDYMRVLKNKNRLLTDYQGATGVKTGFTKAAGRCLVFGARRDDFEIVGVVLNCGNWFDEAMRILDSCYARYTWVEMLPDGERVGSVPVIHAEAESLPVVLRGTLAGPVDQDETPLMTIEIDDRVTAPLPAGAQVGWATMRVGEEIIAKRPLVLAEPATSAPSVLLQWIRGWPLLTY